MPITYFIYPETNGRTLEEVNLLFASDSLLVSKNVTEYNRMVAEAGGNVAVAERRLLDTVNAAMAETVAEVASSSDQNSIEGKENVGVSHTEHVNVLAEKLQ